MFDQMCLTIFDRTCTNILVLCVHSFLIGLVQQIEERRLVDRKLRQLPKGQMMSWDGNVESYVDFRKQMQDMLIYDSESLRLSTLKAQINGKEKSFISDLLYNVDSIEEAFSVLDTHYGDIRTVLPRLRAKLDKLPSHPVKETDENRNIKQILNYWKTAQNHGIEEEQWTCTLSRSILRNFPNSTRN